MDLSVEARPNERNWFDIIQAAEYLSVRPRTIHEAVWASELERARLGKRLIFSRAALDEWASSKLEREGHSHRQRIKVA
jgi:excisionase family DNA binding protein